MKNIQKLILEAYGDIKEEKETIKLDTLPKAMQDRLKDRYGEFSKHDFISSDMGTYFKTTGVNKTTGQVSHKIIALPSFASMYNDYKDIVADIKSLMRSDDVRKDKEARELFELIKTNFRKLQRYLRTERPEQYDLIRMRASLQESINMFKSHTSLITEETLWKQLEEAEEDDPEGIQRHIKWLAVLQILQHRLQKAASCAVGIDRVTRKLGDRQRQQQKRTGKNRRNDARGV